MNALKSLEMILNAMDVVNQLDDPQADTSHHTNHHNHYDDMKMLVRSLERISELAEIVRGRILEGDQTMSWQESKIYVAKDYLESIMGGFPVRRFRDDLHHNDEHGESGKVFFK